MYRRTSGMVIMNITHHILTTSGLRPQREAHFTYFTHTSTLSPLHKANEKAWGRFAKLLQAKNN